MLSRDPLRPLVLIAALSMTTASFGIVATTTYGANLDTTYPFVGYIDNFGGTGIAVGPNVFLTAGHVVGGGITGGNTSQTFTLGGTTYSINRSVGAPDIKLSDGSMGHVDLSLVYVNGTLPGYYNVGTSSIAGSQVTMVGYGQTGGVSTDGRGYDLNYVSGQRLSGVNTIDAKIDNYIAPGTTGLNSAGGGPLMLSFLSQAGDAYIGVGDSGGGWFQGNTLVGISDVQFNLSGAANYRYGGFASANTNGYTFNGVFYPAGTEYDGSAAINLADSRLNSFLAPIRNQATPEPATFAALGFGVLAVLRRRRRA